VTVVAGVDVGAGTAKAAIFADRQIISYSILPTGYDSVETARKTTEEALKKAAILFSNLDRIVSTGYSRNIVSFANDELERSKYCK
jgi:activator of 2-hydroxyglutaryl-CoA dehydratase